MKRLKDGYVAMAVCAMGLVSAAFTGPAEPGNMTEATRLVAREPIARATGTDERMGLRKVNLDVPAAHRAKPNSL